jgi:putative ABC transport system permease protein
VVGVVKDYHYASLSEKIGPQVFTRNPGNAYGLAMIKIGPDTETESLKHIEATFKKIFPFNPYSYRFKDQENLKNYESEARWKQMMLFGAILTIFISAIGLFGLTVMSSEKRTKEIGIRKVLGASVTAVVTTLSKDFLKLVTIALLIAMPLSWLLINKWLEKYPYRIALSWQMFAAAAVLVLLIALATVSSQAIRAAIANPVKSLRTE